MSKDLSWNDRFALIDHYKPNNATICAAFNLTPQELTTANKLRLAGTFLPSTDIDPHKYSNIFANVVEDVIEVKPTPVSVPKHKPATVHTLPETATKKIPIKMPQKRGRKGSNIKQALMNVPSTPVPVNDFIKEHSVSVAVLRQAKRFTENLSKEEIEKIGKVVVKQNKETKVLMIWREDI